MKEEATVKHRGAIVICKTCKKQFRVRPSRSKTAKYCSHKCQPRGGFKLSDIAKQHHREATIRAIADGRINVKGEKNPMWGKHHSDETKEKIRITQQGKVGMCGSDNPMYGKKIPRGEVERRRQLQIGKPIHTDEHKKLLSENWKLYNPMSTLEVRKERSELLKITGCGSNNPNWKGGVSFEPYCIKFNKEFKNRVRLFFKHTCVMCGKTQTSPALHVHHVAYNKQSCCDDTKPLFVILCGSCHIRSNGNRLKWETLFTDIIYTKYNGKCYLTKDEFNSIISI